MPDEFDYSHLSDDDLISLVVLCDRQRYAQQQEIGRRGPEFIERLETALRQFFHIPSGHLGDEDSMGTTLSRVSENDMEDI